MEFTQSIVSEHCLGSAMLRNARLMAGSVYPRSAFLSNTIPAAATCDSPGAGMAAVAVPQQSLFVERLCSSPTTKKNIYPWADSVRRFNWTHEAAGETTCRRATTKPTSGKGCATAERFSRPSSSCDPRTLGPAHSTQNTLATFAPAGDGATEFCRCSGTNATRSIWDPVLAGSSGCFAWSSATKGRSCSTKLGLNTYSALPACAALTTGVRPRRRAVQLGRPLPSPRGNGPCAIHQETRKSQKENRPTLASSCLKELKTTKRSNPVNSRKAVA